MISFPGLAVNLQAGTGTLSRNLSCSSLDSIALLNERAKLSDEVHGVTILDGFLDGGAGITAREDAVKVL